MNIGIAPFAAHAGKIYPLERMEKVIQLLKAKQPDCNIYIFCGKGKELELMQEWEKKYDIEIASGKGIRADLEKIKKLDVMISMDSANMHLASLVGVRVVSIWGATHPYAGFLGWGQKMEDCVQRDLPCRPCSIYGKKPCLRGDMACMDINPEEIISRIIPD
jgi:ADP-heptose:LPS heptosyltransferase